MKAFAKIKAKSGNKITIENKNVLEIIYRPQIYITAQSLLQPNPKILKNHVIDKKPIQIERHVIQKSLAKVSNQQKQQMAGSSGISSRNNQYSVKLDQQQQLIQINKKVPTLSFSNLVPQQKSTERNTQNNQINASVSNKSYSVKLQQQQQHVQNIKPPTLSFSNLIPQQKKIEQKKQNVAASPEPRRRRQIFSSDDKLFYKKNALGTPRREKKTLDSQNQPLGLNLQEIRMSNYIENSPVELYNSKNSLIPRKFDQRQKDNNWPIQENDEKNISCFQYLRGDDSRTQKKIFNNNSNGFTKKKQFFQQNSNNRSYVPQKTIANDRNISENKMVRIYKNYSQINFKNRIIKLGQHRLHKKQVKQQDRSKIHSAIYKINNDKSSSQISISVTSVQYGAPFIF